MPTHGLCAGPASWTLVRRPGWLFGGHAIFPPAQQLLEARGAEEDTRATPGKPRRQRSSEPGKQLTHWPSEEVSLKHEPVFSSDWHRSEGLRAGGVAGLGTRRRWASFCGAGSTGTPERLCQESPSGSRGLNAGLGTGTCPQGTRKARQRDFRLDSRLPKQRKRQLRSLTAEGIHVTLVLGAGSGAQRLILGEGSALSHTPAQDAQVHTTEHP